MPPRNAKHGTLISGSRVNQLGGNYRNGKPLSNEMRRNVIQMSMSGVRPCEISRKLKITHGCISKLLSKFYKTGSLNPGHGTAGRPRVITPKIEEQIRKIRTEQPGIFTWEIRERLLRENVCGQTNLPSLSSISRLVKTMMQRQSSEGFEKKVGVMRAAREEKKAKPPGSFTSKYTIDSILSNNFSRARSRDVVDYRSVMYPRPHAERGSSESREFETLLNHELNSKKESEPSNCTNRPKRMRFERRQMEYLEKSFQHNPYPTLNERIGLAKLLSVDVARIQVWFSNRRAKNKKMTPPAYIHPSFTLTSSDEERFFPYSTFRHLPQEPVYITVPAGPALNPGPSRLFFPPGYHQPGRL